jgi:ribosome-binding protein aMBF1 (putative translation factor)
MMTKNEALSADDPNPRHPASVSRFAAMVRKYREKRGWSQSTLAETANVSSDTICRMESGKADPPFSLVANLTRILSLPLKNAVFNQRVSKLVQVGRPEGFETESDPEID